MTGEMLLIAIIGGCRAAFCAADVRSVIDLDRIVPVPLAPPHIAGLTARRSQALTVIDCRKALRLSEGPQCDEKRAVVVEVEGHAYALLVDSADDVAEALAAPNRSHATLGSYWDRVTEGMIETSCGPAVLVDVGAMVDGGERRSARVEAA